MKKLVAFVDIKVLITFIDYVYLETVSLEYSFKDPRMRS